MRATISLAGAILLAAWVQGGTAAPPARPGWALYDRLCSPCHGSVGDGQGPAAPYTRGRPRDLTRGDYAWRSTPLGMPPTDEDLRATIRYGVVGTSMPGFELPAAQLDELVAVVKSFAPAVFAGGGAGGAGSGASGAASAGAASGASAAGARAGGAGAGSASGASAAGAHAGGAGAGSASGASAAGAHAGGAGAGSASAGGAGAGGAGGIGGGAGAGGAGTGGRGRVAGSSGVIALAAVPPAVDRTRGAALWTRHGCSGCHGAGGTGDTPAAAALARPPYDLTREPLRRPRSSDDPVARRRAAAMSIATGLASGAMPGYAETLTEAELWALADHVVALGARVPEAPASSTATDARVATGAASTAPIAGAPTTPSDTASWIAASRPGIGGPWVPPPSPPLDAAAIAADRTARIATGTWPGHGAPDEARVFGGPIAPQGPPPPELAPAQASLEPRQCARCHAKQYREWTPSLHAGAVSPGLAAQMFELPPERVASCLRCHAPLAEQRTDEDLRASGVGCAGCHVRGWTRHGPPAPSPSLLPIAGYPARPLALYERGDFCLPCHQLPPRAAVAGRPLLNTYVEWLEGPYMRRGVQCQHCHMPNREHTFLGIHDPETFRQGAALSATAHARGGTVTVVAELANVGAGHYLPTTPTPAAWISIRLVDRARRPIEGATASQRIGRDISFDGERWHEHADTRIPPGGRRAVARAWSGGRTAEAAFARVSVEVRPDDYYERLYEAQLRQPLVPARRALYEEALAKARRARYVAYERDVPIVPGR